MFSSTLRLYLFSCSSVTTDTFINSCKEKTENTCVWSEATCRWRVNNRCLCSYHRWIMANSLQSDSLISSGNICVSVSGWCVCVQNERDSEQTAVNSVVWMCDVSGFHLQASSLWCNKWLWLVLFIFSLWCFF